MTDVQHKTRNERLLSLISRGEASMHTLSILFGCPEASIRRSLQELRRDDYHIVVVEGWVKCYGKRSALIACEDDSNNVGGEDDADYQR